eukprot:157009-Amorphochlora_amoeboformis.AAC.1
MPLDDDEARYRSNVVLHNLPRPQALQQAFDSLMHLEKVVEDSFKRIGVKIVAERRNFDEISRRIEVCKEKVNILQVKGKSRATTLTARLSRYPAPERLADNARVFPEENHVLSEPQRKKLNPRKADFLNAAERANTSELFSELSKLIPKIGSTGREEKNQSSDEGLGKLPHYLPSISSVLLFNSSENPYKDYSSFDNLVSSLTKEKETIQDVELAAAPTTLIEGTDLPSFDNPMEALKYAPQIEELPTLDLPENLPLGQLADISFLPHTTKEGSIAPSMANLHNLPTDLKDLPPISAASRKQPATTIDLPSIPDLHVTTAPSSVPVTPASGAGGPSPPPEPLSEGVPPPPQMDIPAPAPAPASPKASGGRDALLSAIRAGKKLKKRKERK